MTYTVTLPWPPTVNHLYMQLRGSHQKVRTKRAREFFEKSSAIIASLPKPVWQEGRRFKVEILFRAPDKRVRDIDNFVKATVDALKGRVIADDSLIDSEHTYRGAKIKGGAVAVRVTELLEYREPVDFDEAREIGL